MSEWSSMCVTNVPLQRAYKTLLRSTGFSAHKMSKCMTGMAQSLLASLHLDLIFTAAAPEIPVTMLSV